MKARSIITIIISLFATIAMAQEQQPAFPGAEGFGMYTTGGRGGKVYHVTTLEDNNNVGSLRYALGRSETRTVVFDVSGTIHLKSELKLGKGNVTIAGQTAPGDGICIADYPFVIGADNVIIRYIRFRLGNEKVAYHEGDGLGGMDRKNIIVDHCSVSWSIDECLSVYGSKNLTVQWCIASHSLVNSGHSKGAHGYGGNWGGSGASYHHNLIAHHGSRTPRLGPRPGTQCDERMDFRNNVIYNWGGNGCYGGEGMNVNIVNNYYKEGPATRTLSLQKRQRIACINIRTTDYCKITEWNEDGTPANGNDWRKMWHVWGHFFVEGNVFPDNEQVTADNWTYGIDKQIDKNGNDKTYTEVTADTIRLREPIDILPVTTHTAETAYNKVCEYAGASLHRDSYDNVIINDTRTGTAYYHRAKDNTGLVDSQEDCGGWPELASLPAPEDSDGDGMPDEWESANGLNPTDANDGAALCEDGYTNLEHYMNSLVQHITDGCTSLTDGISHTHADSNAASARTYNLQGQTVSTPQSRQVYISDGKKYIAK